MKIIQKSKSANYTEVFTFIIMAFAITIFFGIMYYAFTQLNTVLTTVNFDIGTGVHATNFSNIVEESWGSVYDAYGQLKTLAYVLIFGMIISILGSAWLVKRPPIYLVIYVIVSAIAIIVATSISNAYLLLLNNGDFGATLQTFKGSSYILLNLPAIAVVVSLLSGLISLISLNKSKHESEGLP